MTYAGRPVLLDLILPDGTLIPARPYAEATEGLLRDAHLLVVPLSPGSRSNWPERVIGVEGVVVKREGHPHERLPATVRWATSDEVEELWPYARSALRGWSVPPDPPQNARIVVIELQR